MNRRKRFVLAVLASALLAGCGPRLTQSQAQAAVDRWIEGPTGPSSTGSAVVVSLTAIPGENEILAELRVKHFPNTEGIMSPTEDSGEAIFSRYTDGPWVLTTVTWDSNRVSAHPNIVVR
jgi:hypothetical protein